MINENIDATDLNIQPVNENCKKLPV